MPTVMTVSRWCPRAPPDESCSALNPGPWGSAALPTCHLSTGVSGSGWAAGAHRSAPAPCEHHSLAQMAGPGDPSSSGPAPLCTSCGQRSASLWSRVSSRTFSHHLPSVHPDRPGLPPKCPLSAPAAPAEWAASYVSLATAQQAGPRFRTGSWRRAGRGSARRPRFTHPHGAALSLEGVQTALPATAQSWSPGPEAA